MTNFDSYLEPPEPNDIPTYKCDFCDGKGKLVDDDSEIYDCEGCGGSGEIEYQECAYCERYICSCDEEYEAWRDRDY